MIAILLEGTNGFRTSISEDIGALLILVFPILILIALILALAKQKQAAKKILLFAGIELLIGAGLCGLG